MAQDVSPTMGFSNFPFLMGQENDADVAQVGGRIIRLTAGGTLLTGDAVYLSAALTVNKSATAANAKYRMGIIVGGASFSQAREVATDANLMGKTAATVGQVVYVLISGIYWVLAQGTINLHDQIKLSGTTSGAVVAGAVLSAGTLTGAPDKGTLAITSGAVAVTSAAANGASDITGAPGIGTLAQVAPAGDSNNSNLGIMLENATDGQYKRALIYLA